MKETPRFLHDAFMRDDRKMKRIMKRCGLMAYLFCSALIEEMRKEQSLSFRYEDLDLLCDDLNRYTTEESRVVSNDLLLVVQAAMEEELFIAIDEDSFTAPALVRDQEKFEAKRDKWREQKRKKKIPSGFREDSTRNDSGSVKSSAAEVEEEEGEEEEEGKEEENENLEEKEEPGKTPAAEIPLVSLGKHIKLDEIAHEQILMLFHQHGANEPPIFQAAIDAVDRHLQLHEEQRTPDMCETAMRTFGLKAALSMMKQSNGGRATGENGKQKSKLERDLEQLAGRTAA